MTLRFMMLPGVEFTECFIPVAADASLKTQVETNLKKHKDGWRKHSCDIEATFLEPTIVNEMCFETHPAMIRCAFLTED